ncbi:MAG: membrane protein insertion efficiency factor YidD [Thermodesulfobacteriota bacterium]
MKKLLKLLIYIYKKFISPVLPNVCRFYPSCSKYAYDSIEVHGAARGVLLTLWRLLKCHPFHPGGYDPVPATKTRDIAQKIKAL